MKKLQQRSIISFLILLFISYSSVLLAQNPLLNFDFENNLKSGNYQFDGTGYSFGTGVEDLALELSSSQGYQSISLPNVKLDGSKDFSIQCWIKTSSPHPTVFLSQKDFNNKSTSAQKHEGWALYSAEGTFAWSIGSGTRRINYERDNGEKMPINDGKWHHMTITYSKVHSEFRLYYDGHNKAIYKVNFDFQNNEDLVIGSTNKHFDYDNTFSPDMLSGLEELQAYVDEFNSIGLAPLEDSEFIDLIVSPDKLIAKRLEKEVGSKATKDSFSKALDIRKKLVANPYTVYQNMELTMLKPISKIYALQEGKVVINKAAGLAFTQDEKLYPSNFSMDKLQVWDRTITAEEVLNYYGKHAKAKPNKLAKNQKELTIGVWNIWHGGIHWSLEADGWDSRLRIAEMIREKNLDVVLLQETYSSGDFIAAELGYYFATTSDWDYCYQGANISVISRYPIREVQVSEETEFNNVAVKLSISQTQEIWAMSNWYGMAQFPTVFDFHASRFETADQIPVVFGGDFNAVPHTDGGKSPASEKMLQEGFTDAFRSLYPNAKDYPGFSHRSGRRIDQLYYKGKGLINESTEVVSTWPGGFPSDHFLIVSKFKLEF